MAFRFVPWRLAAAASGGVGPVGGQRPGAPSTATAAKQVKGKEVPADAATARKQVKPLFAAQFGPEADDDLSKPANVKDEVKGAVASANERFMGRVDMLNKGYTKLFDKADKAEQKRKAKRKVERHSMLTFREVDDSLDRVILSRDLFLWAKSFYRGVDYVLDQFLERELRYYVMNANAELESSPKLFRGLPYLSKESTSKPFPSLSVSRMDHIAPASVKCKDPKFTDDGTALRQLPKNLPTQTPSCAETVAAPGVYQPKGGPVVLPRSAKQTIFAGEAAKYDTAKDPKFTLNHATFKRPTMVVMCQMANRKYNGELEWLNLYNDYVTKQAKDGTPRCSDVIRIRTIDQPSVQIMRKTVVTRYAEYLPPQERPNCYVGRQLCRKFTEDFDLRNFMTTYCFLVDHRGKVRWMSSGRPVDLEEEKHFSNALNALEAEHYRAGGTPIVS